MLFFPRGLICTNLLICLEVHFLCKRIQRYKRMDVQESILALFHCDLIYRQLIEYDEAIEEAIAMEKDEQSQRMELMTTAVESYTVSDWAKEQIEALEN